MKKYGDEFARAGLNINSPEFGVLLEASDHSDLHKFWTKSWDDFFSTYRRAGATPPPDAILRHLGGLRSRSASILSKGARAPCSYWTWGRMGKQGRHRLGRKLLGRLGGLVTLFFVGKAYSEDGVQGAVDEAAWPVSSKNINAGQKAVSDAVDRKSEEIRQRRFGDLLD